MEPDDLYIASIQLIELWDQLGLDTLELTRGIGATDATRLVAMLSQVRLAIQFIEEPAAMRDFQC